VEAQIPAQAPENVIPAGDAIAQLLEQDAPVAPAPAVVAPDAPAAAPQAIAPAPLKKAAPKPATPAKVTGPISQHYRIHMASLPNKAAAEAEMKRLWSRNKDILGKYKGAITRIEGEKGTFYKVIAGPMDSGDAASAVCKKLSHHKTACFVMKPKP
jgi:cell division septation protein DedD